MIASLAALLSQEVFEVLCRERYDLSFGARVLFDDRFGVVLQDVGQLVGDDNLLRAIYSLLPYISHAFLSVSNYQILKYITS